MAESLALGGAWKCVPPAVFKASILSLMMRFPSALNNMVSSPWILLPFSAPFLRGSGASPSLTRNLGEHAKIIMPASVMGAPEPDSGELKVRVPIC